MTVFIVFEYKEYANDIIGVYSNYDDAKCKFMENPTWRYIEAYNVDEENIQC